MDIEETASINPNIDHEEQLDPIYDIIDYLIRCAKVSLRSVNESNVNIHTREKIEIAYKLFKESPKNFLIKFGKYLAPYHLTYFEKLELPCGDEQSSLQDYICNLKLYHSDDIKLKRIRNRRYKALQKLQEESDYFSEKQMMFRNPLLYEQLVGQYLDDDEIRNRDGVDQHNLTFLSMILDTVDHNKMREMKNAQMLEENVESSESEVNSDNEDEKKYRTKRQWGDFDTPDPEPSFKPEVRKKAMINAPERALLKEEFLQEMYSSFINGDDADIDYDEIDNNEQYDDLQQLSRDAEDRYFDSESNNTDNLEEHMRLVEEYGKQESKESNGNEDDPLDIFMEHLKNKTKISL